jgi:hypothetical protein
MEKARPFLPGRDIELRWFLFEFRDPSTQPISIAQGPVEISGRLPAIAGGESKLIAQARHFVPQIGVGCFRADHGRFPVSQGALIAGPGKCEKTNRDGKRHDGRCCRDLHSRRQHDLRRSATHAQIDANFGQASASPARYLADQFPHPP